MNHTTLTRLPYLSLALFVALGGVTACSSSPEPGDQASTTSGQTGGAGGAGQEGGGDQGGQGAAESASVDVYLAVGEMGAAKGCYFLGDMLSDASGCSLYRLRVQLDDGIVQEHAAVVTSADKGTWQPTVSHDGRIAFALADGNKVLVHSRALDAPADDVGTVVAEGRWTWPNWSPDGSLNMGETVKTGLSCYLSMGPMAGNCTQVERWSSTHRVAFDGATPLSPQLLAGMTGFSFDDTWTNPQHAELVAGHGKYQTDLETLPSCDGKPATSTDCKQVGYSPKPSVIDANTGDHWTFELSSDEAKFFDKGKPLPLEGCAHLAWSPDGKKLLCTEQGTMADGFMQSRIFTFDFDRNTDPKNVVSSKMASPLFEHRESTEMFTLAQGEACSVYYHKYAEWCGSEDFVVATVGCGCETTQCTNETGGEPKMIGERIYLIGVSDPSAPVYYDLNAQLESKLGAASGSLTSFTATCGALIP